MWPDYAAAALRYMARHRLTTLLGLIGLGVGYAAAMLALLYVVHETSFDAFIPGSQKVFVATSRLSMTGQGTSVEARTPTYLAGWMREDFPGLETTRLLPTQLEVKNGDVESSEAIGWADPNFFSFLQLPAVSGDMATALSQPDQLVITRGMARKYFGQDSPVGGILELDHMPFRVMAVIEDLPSATHLTTRIFGSGLNRAFGLQKFDDEPWPVNGQMPAITYVRVAAGSNFTPHGFQRAMPDFVQRHMGRLFDLFKGRISIDLRLVPLRDLHLSPAGEGKPGIVAAASIIGLLIMFVAIFNFVNLMVAQSAQRGVEVGVRKASGATRGDLVLQFLGESLVFVAMAFALAIVLVHFMLPEVETRLVPGIAEQWKLARILAVGVPLVTLTGVLGGLYPALMLSNLAPARALTGGGDRGRSRGGLQLLVAFQFSVFIGLSLAVLVMLRQTTFALRDGLRFPQDQLLFVYTACPSPFTEQLRGLKGVVGTACAAGDPTTFAPRALTQATARDGTQINVEIGSVGFGFLDLLGVPPIAGRLYDEARDSPATEDERAPLAVLNESAVRSLGFPSAQAAIGARVDFIQNQGGPPSEVIGVVPDFTFDVRSQRVGPMVYWLTQGKARVVHVKLSGRGIPETIDAIDSLWKKAGDPKPIHRMFLDQRLRALYAATIQETTVTSGLALVAISMAALGLFGLSASVAQRRTKEMGIRKTMGATRGDVLRMMLLQFMKPVLWANVIAWPVAYFAMQRWLEGFAYHVDMRPWMFLAASGMAAGIALATVAGHALLVARVRPAMALRHE